MLRLGALVLPLRTLRSVVGEGARTALVQLLMLSSMSVSCSDPELGWSPEYAKAEDDVEAMLLTSAFAVEEEAKVV